MADTPQNSQSATRQEFEADLIARARADAGFKQRLLADPRAAFKEAYGAEPPEDVEIQVLEEQPRKFFIVIPISDESGSGELTDEQLAAVAGGAVNDRSIAGSLPGGSLDALRLNATAASLGSLPSPGLQR